MHESWKAYRRALWKHSKTLISGSAAGLLGIVLSIRPVVMPAWVWFLLALASYVWVGFLAFHDVRVERDGTLSLRAAGNRHDFAGEVLKDFAWDASILLADPQLDGGRISYWTNDISNFLRMAYGAIEETKFIGPGQLLPSRDRHAIVTLYRSRLDDVMQRFDTLKLRDDFDPTQWEAYAEHVQELRLDSEEDA